MGMLSRRRLRAAAFPVLVAGALATALALPGVAVDADSQSRVGHTDTVRPAAAPATQQGTTGPASPQQYADAGAITNYANAVLLNEYVEAVQRAQFEDAANRLLQERAAAAAAAAAAETHRFRATTVASGGGGGGGGGCSGNTDCFLACTRAHESDTAGGYQAVGGGGRYRGAYQFDQQTWNSNAAASGRADLVGQDPASVAPAAQDQVAADTYARRGNAPWGGRC
jgi:hypothetical protein